MKNNKSKSQSKARDVGPKKNLVQTKGEKKKPSKKNAKP